MFITLESDYAIRLVCYLAKEKKQIDGKTMAEKNHVSQRFCFKILRKLVTHQLVISTKGSKGGYLLNVDPATISIKDIIELIDGPIYINKCLHKDPLCNHNTLGTCRMKPAFMKISKVLQKELEDVKIIDLL